MPSEANSARPSVSSCSKAQTRCRPRDRRSSVAEVAPGIAAQRLAAELLEGPLPAEDLDVVPGDDQPAALAVHLAEGRVGHHHPVEPRCHRLRHPCTSG